LTQPDDVREVDMTHGSGQGSRRGGRGGGRGVARYVEASLLILLVEGPAHGHELNRRLVEVFPLAEHLPDVSTVYRTLSDLERQGAANAQWGPGEGGGRKVYELTQEGRELLAFWDGLFRKEHEGLGGFLDHYQRMIGTSKPTSND